MPTPSKEIIQLFSYFSVVFTAPTFKKVLVLVYGTILAPGRRTVASALRAVGLGNEKNFNKYHRVLNRDRWSPRHNGVPGGVGTPLCLGEQGYLWEIRVWQRERRYFRFPRH